MNPNKLLKKVTQPKDYACNLIKFSKNIYSQNGEDGVVLELIRRLDIKNGHACEFGAWDGKKFSNTFNLVEKYNWKCIMIEGDHFKYEKLVETSEENKNITPVRALIHYLDGKGILLDHALSAFDIPQDFDILSIDVDSCDYHIWKSLQNYNPKIVIIEHSGKDEEIIQREGARHKIDIDGSTAFPPMKRLGEEKGYTLLCDTGNMIFIKKELLETVL